VTCTVFITLCRPKQDATRLANIFQHHPTTRLHSVPAAVMHHFTEFSRNNIPISESQYDDLVGFIIKTVADKSHDEQGVYHKIVTNSYLAAYYPTSAPIEDEEYLPDQTRFITKFLRHLIQVCAMLCANGSCGGC
jgi:hypothetical protein